MRKLHEIEGKTIREWADADLPHGAFTTMVRKIDPCYGVYAEAGATKRAYRVTLLNPSGEIEDIEVDAFNELHAKSIAWDEHHWHPRHTRARLLTREREDVA